MRYEDVDTKFPGCQLAQKAALTLRINDLLLSRVNPWEAEELSNTLGAKLDSIQRVLNTGVDEGVFVQTSTGYTMSQAVRERYRDFLIDIERMKHHVDRYAATMHVGGSNE